MINRSVYRFFLQSLSDLFYITTRPAIHFCFISSSRYYLYCFPSEKLSYSRRPFLFLVCFGSHDCLFDNFTPFVYLLKENWINNASNKRLDKYNFCWKNNENFGIREYKQIKLNDI